eukprot:7288569-Prymnesium_polylepis.2
MANDYFSSMTWIHMLTDMKKQGYFKSQPGYKRFSVNKQLLQFVKKLYPDAPFDVQTVRKLSGTVLWWKCAKMAIESVLNAKMKQDGHGLGQIIPDWDLATTAVAQSRPRIAVAPIVSQTPPTAAQLPSAVA